MKIKSFFVGLLVLGMTATIPMVVTSCKEENVVAAIDNEEDAENLRSCPGCGDCVSWVHCKFKANGKSLPFGLISYQSKKNLINAYSPVAGYAAIMPGDTKYGHIAYVESVNSDGTITITEGNFTSKKCTTRTKKPADLKIDGYYKP